MSHDPAILEPQACEAFSRSLPECLDHPLAFCGMWQDANEPGGGA
jgi:hypothetical protein